MAGERRYYGSAYATKDWRGAKSVNLRLPREAALRLAEALLKGAQASQQVDFAIYPAKSVGHEARITVTSDTR